MTSSPLRIGLIALLVASLCAAQAAKAQTKQEANTALAAPRADQIPAALLALAVRQAVANGAASLVARITAEGNDHGLAFPPSQTMKVLEVVEVPVRRVQVERPVFEYEYATVEKVVPVLESGQPTGRFTKVKERVAVKRKQVGTQMVDEFVGDPNGSERKKVNTYGPGGPAAWTANLPGLNGMALYVLAKAGLGSHPAAVRHAEALARHAAACGLPDTTFDIAWMAAGFAALGPDSAHSPLAKRLLAKLVDGQVREKGDLDGLWGPVCVNYGCYGKLFTLGQTLRQEIEINVPKKLETATPAAQAEIVRMADEMHKVRTQADRMSKDAFRRGTQMLQIRNALVIDDEVIVPGLPLNAYQWVVTDVESTDAAAFALAEGKRSRLLPQETERLMIRDKKIYPPVKTEAALKAAAKRLADAIDDDGHTPALAFAATNTGFENSGFAAPTFEDATQPPSLFNIETACTCVAAQDAIESLTIAAPALAKPLEEPRKRARASAATIAARWYEESANPAAEPWKGIYVAAKISQADLAKSSRLPPPERKTDVESMPWGPSGCLYRIVPGFRGLFAAAGSPQACLSDDLFRRIAYRLVALQDQSGQWSSAGNALLSTASEALTINRVARTWHSILSSDPPGRIRIPDPVSYELMLDPETARWVHPHAARPDAAVYPTLASLLFLVQAVDSPVSLDGITILPEPPAAAATPASADQPPPRLAAVDAARLGIRPNEPRTKLFDAIAGRQRPATAAAVADTPAEGKLAETPAPEEESESLGTFEDLLNPSDTKN